MRIYVTSDLHFNHLNLTKHLPATRPHFTNANELNQWLINKWNSVVKKNDTVYHLGDFSVYSNKTFLMDMIEKLNGNIIFIKGNHDKNLHKVTMAHDYLELNYNDITICMSHYPMLTWNKKHHGSIHLFGHCHGQSKFRNGRSMDVGIDANNTILTLDDCVNMMLEVDKDLFEII